MLGQKKNHRQRHWSIKSLRQAMNSLIGTSASTLYQFIAKNKIQREYIPEIDFQKIKKSKGPIQPLLHSSKTLKVLSLNIAHCRKDGVHQIFQTSRQIKQNLIEISKVLKREAADVVALQEADGPSFWSGDFDHVKNVAKESSYPYSLRGEHVGGFKLSYGTALMLQHKCFDPLSYSFLPSPPTFNKGFVVTAFKWPHTPHFELDVVSVHLDFSRESVRKKQIDELVSKLAERKRPMIIMGDFNRGWKNRRSILKTLVAELKLQAYQPGVSGFETFPLTKQRLDWILISQEFTFKNYEILPYRLSDHYAVTAEIELKN